ncbi:capsular exopolysaccharide family domain protein [Synechococcus sp. BIOS-E4-1]|uniref:GumC family protein n=1 Tax=Synechococcus sp. BIOS-E4-1 TaxID=1400864 RepID=UPI0016496640|nr:Wzz/FepE/Etk N-terminal domain-containing protein [Synechococcus sp. BIOS-E4-1]QNI52857.1 capsular exopolysaccharide family domain protein [Synechococcus sp. BIOS-E4-1]
MTKNPSSSQTVNVASAQADDEIDLRQVAGALLRHKFLIAKIAAATLVLSGLYAFTRNPVWEGQFQIVLQNETETSSRAMSLLQSNPGLANLIGVGAGSSDLETEVQILESPSVLKPIFDFVKIQKAKSGEDVSKWRYKNWVEDNLSIELEKGTSVLNLEYRDTDKELVLPVINRISKAYQSYSGRDRAKGISQAISYLDEQIGIYQNKSVTSLKTAQNFAIEQDLTALQGDGESDNEIKNAINIEAIRVQAANEIRNINEQLKQLNQLNDNPETLMYLGRNIPELASQGLPQTLDQLDTQLALLRAKYTDKDDSIRRLLERRRLLIEVFKRQTYGYLYAQRTAAEARLAAAERPKGVLIKYRELLRTAARDEATLTRLEAERQVFALEQARNEEPWELISTPTLLDNPVAPRKKRMMALGLLAGIVLGSGVSLVVDRRTGLVFSTDELQSLLPCPLLKHLSAMAQDTWTDAADLLASGPLAETGGNTAIALIPLGNIPSDQLQAFSEELSRALKGRDLVVSADLRKTSECATQLLLAAPGVVTRTQLSQFSQKLALQGAPLAGWVLLDPELDLG